MTRSAVAAVLSLLLLLTAACTGDDFADGRETATVHRIEPSDWGANGDGDVELALLVGVLDWPHTEFGDQSGTIRTRNRGWVSRGFDGPGKSGFTINFIDGVWSYAAPGFVDDQYCRRCEPTSVTAEEAVERARDLLVELSLDPADFATRTIERTDDEGRPISVLVISNLVIDGVITEIRWTAGYGDADGGLRSASGNFVEITEVADVPLFTPEEALVGAGRESTPEALADIELTADARLDRPTGTMWLVPVYSVPVSDSLDTTVTIAATRPEDLPSE